MRRAARPMATLRYADDAFAVAFTLPDSIAGRCGNAGGAVPRPVRPDGKALDAGPATAADWSSGHWIRYEDTDGTEGDTGSTDCSYKPFVAGLRYRPRWLPAAQPSSSATPPPPPDRGGGGDGSGLLLMLLGLLLILSTPHFAKRQGVDSHSGHAGR